MITGTKVTIQPTTKRRYGVTIQLQSQGRHKIRPTHSDGDFSSRSEAEEWAVKYITSLRNRELPIEWEGRPDRVAL